MRAINTVKTKAGIVQPGFDKATNVQMAIDYAHHEIHSGSHYYVEGFAVLGNGDTLFVKLQTPNTTTWAHFVWRIQSSAYLSTFLYEAPTGGMTGGAAVTPLNNDRNSANTSGIIITSNVGTCTGGLTISAESFGSRQAGGAVSREDELILKQNTIYCREFYSLAASNVVSFKASWYEHSNKE